jgi:hypothetical protein
MVTEAEDLEQTLREVEKHLEREGFTVFYGAETSRSASLAEVQWSEEKSGWKGFLQAAKDAGAKVVVFQATSLEDEELQAMLPEGGREETESTEALTELKKYVGKIGCLSLFWFKDGVKYGLLLATDWWEKFMTLRMEAHQRSSFPALEVHPRRFMREELMRHEVASDFMEKSEEELDNELIEFMKKEFPSADQRSFYAATDIFWRSKGVETHMFPKDPNIDLKVEKAKSLARLKLEQETQEREKEVVPKLTDECVDWAKQNQLRKVTKTNVDYFLTEKGQTPSKTSRDAIYNKANMLLARERRSTM